MDSIWSKTVQIGRREPLLRDMDTQVAVIGAGMAGLLTAYLLKEQGKEVIVLEASRIASGQTKNTTAKLTSQHGAVYSKLLEDFGKSKTKLYFKANEDAIDAYENIVDKNRIDCHFERVSSYLYSKVQTQELEKEMEALKAVGIKARFKEKPPLPFQVKGAICFPGQAQFNPLEFVKNISKDLRIYERTKVLHVSGQKIVTNRGTVTAKHIIFAAHYPFPIFPGLYFARQHQSRSYVVAIKGVPKWKGMYYSVDAGGLSFRWYGDTLLVGGGGHRTGTKVADAPKEIPAGVTIPHACGYSVLRQKIREIYPEFEEVAAWSAQDCITHDGLPFIGKFSIFQPHWYVATGFNKWGMTGSMISAQIISDMICGNENPYEKLFTPQRFNYKASKEKLIKDIKISTKGLKNGSLHTSTVRCPHMGCELDWNPEENTWDCPCHGSRFKGNGELIDNPSLRGIGGKY